MPPLLFLKLFLAKDKRKKEVCLFFVAQLKNKDLVLLSKSLQIQNFLTLRLSLTASGSLLMLK